MTLYRTRQKGDFQFFLISTRTGTVTLYSYQSFSSSLFRQEFTYAGAAIATLSVLPYFDGGGGGLGMTRLSFSSSLFRLHPSELLPLLRIFQFFLISTFWCYASEYCLTLSVLPYFDEIESQWLVLSIIFQFFLISTRYPYEEAVNSVLSVLPYFDYHYKK